MRRANSPPHPPRATNLRNAENTEENSFRQPGGGDDRNITENRTLRPMIEYLHGNPVRRGLVAEAEDGEWSSARWFAGMGAVNNEMDRQVPTELQSEYKYGKMHPLRRFKACHPPREL